MIEANEEKCKHGGEAEAKAKTFGWKKMKANQFGLICGYEIDGKFLGRRRQSILVSKCEEENERYNLIFYLKICFPNDYWIQFHPFNSFVSWFGDLEIGLKETMEHGSFTDNSAATFSLTDEDHTIANAVRFNLNQDPKVTFCGYSIPHPSEARVNIRVQTTGDPAKEVLKDACQNLMLMCRNVRCTFDKAVEDFKASNAVKAMKIDSQDSSGDDSEESE
ncbi:hypothetical protein GOBAR_DD16535 [Gossypium barbadense]|nr:hypothetical protein GOBAR_DD16535 [Gossypium barbadense]